MQEDYKVITLVLVLAMSTTINFLLYSVVKDYQDTIGYLENMMDTLSKKLEEKE